MKEKRTYADRREYIKKAVIARRRKVKRMAVELMGGSCQICGYDKHPGVLEFHHLDASTKLFGISGSGLTRGWSTVLLELEKCVMVCANCHREIEMGITPAPTPIYRGARTS